MRLRELCQRRGLHPYILAVVQDPFKTVALTSVTDYRGTPYDLHFLGARDMLYSESNILHSRLEAEALTRHLNGETRMCSGAMSSTIAPPSPRSSTIG